MWFAGGGCVVIREGSDSHRLLVVLSDGMAHRGDGLYRLGMMVHSRVADLRRHGFGVDCWRDGDQYWYRLANWPGWWWDLPVDEDVANVTIPRKREGGSL